MTQTDNDRHLCWERVLRSNKSFRISHLFAPEDYSGPLLALHALFASIDQLSSEVSEDLVARQKLDWWRLELSPDQMERSRHPVIRHLVETGASALLPASALAAQLDTAERRLDAYPLSNMKEFNQLSRLIYQPRIDLECALCGLDSAFISDHKAVACAGGLLQLLRESLVQANHRFWWIPLDLLARFGATRQDLRENSDEHASRAVFRHILEGGGERPALQDHRDQLQAATPPGLLHLQLTALLQTRQLFHLRGKKPSRFGAELNRWHISDLMLAWNMARQNKKKAATGC
jgi:phytoene synthase